jgi:hypothetical protein
MHRATGRQLSIPQDNLLRALDNGAVNREHLIYYTEQSIESWLNCVAAIVMLTPIGTNCRVYESKMESL